MASGIHGTRLKKGQMCIQVSKPLDPQERQVLKWAYRINSYIYSSIITIQHLLWESGWLLVTWQHRASEGQPSL